MIPATLKRPVKRLLYDWDARARRRAPCVTILMLHDVHPRGFTPDAFEELVDRLSRRVDFLRLDDAANRLRNGSALRRDAVVLTFDDGLENNFVYAYPILARYRASATFFIVPGLIDEARWLWTHEVRALLTESHASPDRHETATAMIDAMKQWPERRRDDLLRALRAAHSDLALTHPDRDRYALMNWDQLRALDHDLVEIGSHSQSHTMLVDLPGDRLRQEIQCSKDAIEAKLGRAVRSFSFPNGLFDDASLAWVRRCYEQAVTTVPASIGRASDLHLLPRIYVTDPIDTLFRMARSRS
jgi:peptidoglycan/xylan/chitin deacetylase (PgdA/CDA1 family)